jgi:hypothetical protein
LKSKNALSNYLNFLRSHNAQNYRWRHGEHTIEELFLRYKAQNNPFQLIMDAFEWGDSFYGFYYWRSLHLDWMRKLEQMEKKGILCDENYA